MLPRFEAHAALQLMGKEKVTFFAGVPTMYWGLLGALEDVRAAGGVDVEELARNLRVAAAGGAALPVEVHKEFQKRFGVTILEGYGLSETSPVASFSPRGEEVAGRVDRQADPRRRDEADRPGVERGQRRRQRPRRGRRDRDQGPQHHEGLLRPARGHRRGDPRRLVPLRRPGPPGRGRLVLHRRPVQGHDHPRRLQRVPARDRGGPADPPRRLAGRGHRRTRTRATARRSRRSSSSTTAPPSPPRSWSPGARSRWPATSTRASWRSSTRCR